MDNFKVLKDFANSLEDEAYGCREDAYVMRAVLFRVSDTLSQVLKNIEFANNIDKSESNGQA